MGVIGLLALVVSSCDISYPSGDHTATVRYQNCKASNQHLLAQLSGNSTWKSGTYSHGSPCAGGVAARLLYKWTDGNIYMNSWVWDVQAAASYNVGAVSSPESHHTVCRSSTNCKDDFVN